MMNTSKYGKLELGLIIGLVLLTGAIIAFYVAVSLEVKQLFAQMGGSGIKYAISTFVVLGLLSQGLSLYLTENTTAPDIFSFHSYTNDEKQTISVEMEDDVPSAYQPKHSYFVAPKFADPRNWATVSLAQIEESSPAKFACSPTEQDITAQDTILPHNTYGIADASYDSNQIETLVIYDANFNAIKEYSITENTGNSEEN